MSVQEADAASLLHFSRSVLGLRKNNPALRQGALESLAAEDALLRFDRVADDQRVRCIFNLSADALPSPDLPEGHAVVLSVNGAGGAGLPGWSALLVRV